MAVYLKGAGMTKFGVDRRPTTERIQESVNAALEDAELQFDDIDTVFTSNAEAGRNEDRQKHQGPMFSSLFRKNVPILNVRAGCAGGGVALWNAISHLNASNAEHVLVVGYDAVVATATGVLTDEILMGGERKYEQTEGLVFPAQNALVGQQYMAKHGATMDDLTAIAKKNHDNAFHNPKARFYQKKITTEMINKSPVVASPLRLFDCSVSVNGSAAVIISKKKSDIEIAGHAMSTSNLSPTERDDMTSVQASKVASKKAYEMANITAQDLDIAELHDAFTPLELVSYDDLGFSKPGKSIDLIRNGDTLINGKLPVNTSGGLKARGHPISPTGISQVCELVDQMRKRADGRQVDGIKTALAQNIGGVGTFVTCHVLKQTN